MSVFDRLIVRGRAVFKMNAAPETSTVGIPDGTLRLYTDSATGRQYIQTFSRSVTSTGAWETFAPAAALPPVDADYLVGTSNAALSSEIAVGTTPGGELGGTWAVPTVDETHSGSAHHNELHAIDGGDHTGTLAHSALGTVTSDQHHPKLHAHNGVDGSGTVTGSNLTGTPGGELGGTWASPTVDSVHAAASGSHVTNGDSHNHSGGDGAQVSHDALSGVSANDHHNESHTVASHSDTSATGSELNTLTAGGNADSLHLHASGLSLVYSSDSETGPLTSTSKADAVVVDGLSIPAAHSIVAEWNARGVNAAGASRTAYFGFEINTTEVLDPTSNRNAAVIVTNSSTSVDGRFRVHIPSRVTNYTQGGTFERLGQVRSDGASPVDPALGALNWDAASPVATVTSLTIRYYCITAGGDELDLYVNNIRVWELPD